MSSKMRIGIVVLSCLCVCVIVVQIPYVQVAYHHRMMAYWKAQGFTPQVDSTNTTSVAKFSVIGDKFARYDYHRHQLVGLGSIAFRRYQLSPPKVSPETTKLLAHLRERAPPHIDLDYTYSGNYLNIEVYCYPFDLTEWQLVFSKKTSVNAVK